MEANDRLVVNVGERAAAGVQHQQREEVRTRGAPKLETMHGVPRPCPWFAILSFDEVEALTVVVELHGEVRM
eukprot:7064647-Prymnesium_polylepis.1